MKGYKGQTCAEAIPSVLGLGGMASAHVALVTLMVAALLFGCSSTGSGDDDYEKWLGGIADRHELARAKGSEIFRNMDAGRFPSDSSRRQYDQGSAIIADLLEQVSNARPPEGFSDLHALADMCLISDLEYRRSGAKILDHLELVRDGAPLSPSELERLLDLNESWAIEADLKCREFKRELIVRGVST